MADYWNGAQVHLVPIYSANHVPSTAYTPQPREIKRRGRRKRKTQSTIHPLTHGLHRKHNTSVVMRYQTQKAQEWKWSYSKWGDMGLCPAFQVCICLNTFIFPFSSVRSLYLASIFHRSRSVTLHSGTSTSVDITVKVHT